MWSSSPKIAAGDTVVVWMTRDSIQPLVVAPGKDLNSKYGNYRHADFVGVPYGSKIASRTGQGFLYLLRPTPELWTLALPHRTQILYIADIAFITSRLNIKPGARVIEAGTGSGSFTHSVARSIGHSGHLWSYEFHEARANKAREEFLRHGMTDTVTLTHRNVCRDGFTVDNIVDAVFLDLPAPWDAIDHAKKTLRKDRITRICCFSPCIEQVLRTVSALNDAGFTEITMYETLLRPHEVSQIPQLQSIGHVSQKLKEAEKRREEKRLRQIANNKARLNTTTTLTKRKRDDPLDNNDNDNDNDYNTEHDLPPSEAKRVKSSETEAVDKDEMMIKVDDDDTTTHNRGGSTLPVTKQSRISVSNALPDVRGHTSYLTFAVLVPLLSTPPHEDEMAEQQPSGSG
ncbi:hypothetical protein Agabi119p4_7538 [Agaricus bisporus var. burnettii]|uniref:tRNA (adenine(58)-N(1))-methyltransferase catalytic subunit TRM61 n=1 Tax=Agaricus bisporus var. burnettii TaxID=192524 RepID=A0A8H7C8F2_AGABI|nr:hypothetical protein Agabi119p4_7538 [Agaricus bisporus var. burnettii]